MSITMTKLMFAVPMAFFALKLNVYYIIGSIEKDPDILQKGIRSILCFFMTSYATMFYRGKGEFTAFTLNTKGVVSLIMLIMPIVLDFVFMWIHRRNANDGKTFSNRKSTYQRYQDS